MKADEAPKKIYFTSNENGTHYYTEGIPFEREYIEYTRTDVFIEKAATFLCECIEDCMARYMEIWSLEMKEKTVDNFKNYMKQ